MSDCEPRAAVRAALYADERRTLDGLVATAGLDPAARAAISGEAEDLVTAVRARGTPSLMQAFLGEYGLDSLEGVALMCLAEALLRVPDAETIDALISDKIVPADWGRHLGRSSSSLVNASTWALLLTGRVLGEDEDEDLAELLRDAMRRLGRWSTPATCHSPSQGKDAHTPRCAPSHPIRKPTSARRETMQSLSRRTG